MLVSTRFLTFSVFVAAASAAKFIPTINRIPSRAVKMAHDVQRDILIVYDRDNEIIAHVPAQPKTRELEKRLLGSCARFSADDVQKLPGWDKLHQYAVDNWGDGWDSVTTNMDDAKGSPATVCVAAETTPVTLDTPSCAALSQDTFTGTTQGTNVTVELTAEQGTSTQTVITVIEQSAVGVDMSVSASISIPEIADVSAKMNFGVTFTNTMNKADTVTQDSLQGQVITMYADPDTTCTLVVNKRRCDVNGQGSQRLIAHGWAWVNYASPVKDHYKWAMNMDAILNDDERSTFIKFRTATSTELKADYTASCDSPLASMPASFRQ